jgi:phosphate transport system substrate-binding protein
MQLRNDDRFEPRAFMLTRFNRGIFLLTIAVAPALAMAAVDVDKNLPHYTPVSGISGTIKSVGSDTLNNLMTLWSEDFKKAYPNVNTEVEGKGSATAPPALVQGTSQLGPMSRQMKGSEFDEFKKKYGYAPTPVKVAVDALGVFVNKDNPIESLSIDQLRQIFSIDGKEMTWGDLGLSGDWAK